MKIATWNVNSLKVRLPHVLQWLDEQSPDILCLQELKQPDADFPLADIEKAGYRAIFSGQKTYNGVAILSREKGDAIQYGIPGFDDEQKRVIAATYNGIRMVCVYVPNGESVTSDKFQYKLKWLKALNSWIAAEIKRFPGLALLGDFNIAPEDCDVYDPKGWEGNILVSEEERAALKSLFDLGLKDSFRLFPQNEKSFTWWDYRMNAFRRNMGLRIDHILLSEKLAADCIGCAIDLLPRKAERPSDHAPVFAEIKGEEHV